MEKINIQRKLDTYFLFINFFFYFSPFDRFIVYLFVSLFLGLLVYLRYWDLCSTLFCLSYSKFFMLNGDENLFLLFNVHDFNIYAYLGV